MKFLPPSRSLCTAVTPTDSQKEHKGSGSTWGCGEWWKPQSWAALGNLGQWHGRAWNWMDFESLPTQTIQKFTHPSSSSRFLQGVEPRPHCLAQAVPPPVPHPPCCPGAADRSRCTQCWPQRDARGERLKLSLGTGTAQRSLAQDESQLGTAALCPCRQPRCPKDTA